MPGNWYFCTMAKLPKDFYLRDDVVQISKDLLGKELFTSVDGIITSGIITETEAYAGAIDKASHAFGNRRTARTETMFAEGGTSYVYLCYGIHSLFNVVTNQTDIPHAVLIRGIKPKEGLDTILARRNSNYLKKDLTIGPGKVCLALGINYQQHNKLNLQGNLVWIEDNGIKVKATDILAGPRVGVDYAGEDALLPYRFQIFI